VQHVAKTSCVTSTTTEFQNPYGQSPEQLGLTLKLYQLQEGGWMRWSPEVS